ncbi:MAG: CPBP family intramembrane glutamic endopeptidase [Bacteroidota bacterium]
MKTIFYNELGKNIRAGWRMGIFAAALAAMTALFNIPAKLIIPHIHFFPSFVSGELVFYGALLLTTWIIARFLERRPAFSSVGFPLHGNVLREIGQGALIGGGMMTIIFVTEYSFGMVGLSFKPLSFLEATYLFGASIIIFVVGAVGEELLFRGYLFQTMAEGTGKIIAVVVFASFFGYAHSMNPNVTFFSLVNVALAGVWLSLAYFKTRTLWFPIALHFSWNFFQNHIFSFPVSGIQFQKFQLGVMIQSGPAWVTGGSFGPEGGALATLILIVSGVFIYFSDWIVLSENAWTLEKWNRTKAPSALDQQLSESKSEPT